MFWVVVTTTVAVVVGAGVVTAAGLLPELVQPDTRIAAIHTTENKNRPMLFCMSFLLYYLTLIILLCYSCHFLPLLIPDPVRHGFCRQCWIGDLVILYFYNPLMCVGRCKGKKTT